MTLSTLRTTTARTPSGAPSNRVQHKRSQARPSRVAGEFRPLRTRVDDRGDGHGGPDHLT